MVVVAAQMAFQVTEMVKMVVLEEDQKDFPMVHKLLEQVILLANLLCKVIMGVLVDLIIQVGQFKEGEEDTHKLVAMQIIQVELLVGMGVKGLPLMLYILLVVQLQSNAVEEAVAGVPTMVLALEEPLEHRLEKVGNLLLELDLAIVQQLIEAVAEAGDEMVLL